MNKEELLSKINIIDEDTQDEFKMLIDEDDKDGLITFLLSEVSLATHKLKLQEKYSKK